jgi:hypothetical protein
MKPAGAVANDRWRVERMPSLPNPEQQDVERETWAVDLRLLRSLLDDVASSHGAAYSSEDESLFIDTRRAILRRLESQPRVRDMACRIYPESLSSLVNGPELGGWWADIGRHKAIEFENAVDDVFAAVISLDVGGAEEGLSPPAPRRAQDHAREEFHRQYIDAWRLAPKKASGEPTQLAIARAWPESQTGRYRDGIDERTLRNLIALHGYPDGYAPLRKSRRPE